VCILLTKYGALHPSHVCFGFASPSLLA